jgi:mannose-6-phosphate isomerase-like protein (cupin superfamily)
MSSPIIAPLLSGNVIGSANNAFVIAEWKDPGGPAGIRRLIAPFHVHRADDEAWYVLAGTLCVKVGKDDVLARAGSAVLAPRGTPHTYWNPGPEPAHYLLVMTPNIYRRISTQCPTAMLTLWPPCSRSTTQSSSTNRRREDETLPQLNRRNSRRSCLYSKVAAVDSDSAQRAQAAAPPARPRPASREWPGRRGRPGYSAPGAPENEGAAA